MREERLAAGFTLKCAGPPRERGVARRLRVATDKGDKTMKLIEHYKSAIESSTKHLLKEVFAPQVRIEIPVDKRTAMQRAQYLIF